MTELFRYKLWLIKFPLISFINSYYKIKYSVKVALNNLKDATNHKYLRMFLQFLSLQNLLLQYFQPVRKCLSKHAKNKVNNDKYPHIFL